MERVEGSFPVPSGCKIYTRKGSGLSAMKGATIRAGITSHNTNTDGSLRLARLFDRTIFLVFVVAEAEAAEIEMLALQA